MSVGPVGDFLDSAHLPREPHLPVASDFMSFLRKGTLLNAGSHRWMQASTGPLGAALSAPVGCLEGLESLRAYGSLEG